MSALLIPHATPVLLTHHRQLCKISRLHLSTRGVLGHRGLADRFVDGPVAQGDRVGRKVLENHLAVDRTMNAIEEQV